METKLNYSMQPGYQKADLFFWGELLGQDFKHALSRHWVTECETLLDINFTTTYFELSESPKTTHVVGLIDGVLVWLLHDGSNVYANIAAHTTEEAVETYRKLHEQLPTPEVTDTRIPVTFWFHTPHGPQSITRQLEVPTWDSVECNYPGAVRSEIVKMMTLTTGPASGKLWVWHGPPGTGKTFALRALAAQWREWVDCHYLLDPESFFGSAPSDLLQVILGDDERTPELAARWKLLILEDTGEMLAPDAKQSVGQGLSRLLNLVDGLIGQGLRLMVLVTTNEEITHLHRALVRPGRAAGTIKFGTFPREEAAKWLGERNAYDAAGDLTLAELYAIQEARVVAPRPSSMGFQIGGVVSQDAFEASERMRMYRDTGILMLP